jgi:hypothetical protein
MSGIQLRWLVVRGGVTGDFRCLQYRQKVLNLPSGFAPLTQPIKYEWSEWQRVPDYEASPEHIKTNG